MSRRRLAIGTCGDVRFETTASGKVCARTAFRDWDGRCRDVQATAATRRAAEDALKAKLAARFEYQPGTLEVSADSTFARLVDYWLADIELEDRLARQTRDRYAYHMRQLVLPAFANLTLREIGVARCDLINS